MTKRLLPKPNKISEINQINPKPQVKIPEQIINKPEIYTSSSPNPDENVIMPSNSNYVPTRVLVNNKPTIEEITRVYNPYLAQKEYESYMRNGFVFEPLKIKSSDEMKNSQQKNIDKVNSFKSVSQISPINPNINANVAFTSDVISPYSRKETNTYNQAKNDRLLNIAAINNYSHTNMAYKNEPETEFQNFNNLKTISDNRKQQLLYPTLTSYPYNSNNNINSNRNYNNERIYEDGNNLVNIQAIKSNSTSNFDPNKIKTGYQPDTSNA